MNRIAMVRGKQNMTQEDLAKLMGVSRTTVCNWENGKVLKSTMKKIANKLDVPVVSLYGTDIFVIEPSNDDEIKWVLAVLSMYAKDKEFAKRIRELIV